MRIPRDGAGKAGREAQVGKGGERLEQESGLEKAEQAGSGRKEDGEKVGHPAGGKNVAPRAGGSRPLSPVTWYHFHPTGSPAPGQADGQDSCVSRAALGQSLSQKPSDFLTLPLKAQHGLDLSGESEPTGVKRSSQLRMSVGKGCIFSWLPGCSGRGSGLSQQRVPCGGGGGWTHSLAPGRQNLKEGGSYSRAGLLGQGG